MSEALTVLAVVLGLGVGSVMLGDRLGVPNVLFFVVAGLLVGPHGLDLLHLDAFGDDLATVLGASVAVIVFQDSWEISVEQLTDAPRPAYYLATVGSLVTFAGVAAAAYLLMDVAVGVALLIGALLVATGPTVVEPVLATVDVSERLEHALEIEGLVNEVLAAILAVALFKAVTLQETDVEQFALLFSWHLAAGVVVGLAVGGLVWLLFRIPDHDPDRAPQHARLLLLASSVVAYAAAETLAAEAGIAAAATAGLLLGNVGLEYREHVAQFASDVSTLILGFVFILLSSFAELQGLVAVGLGGLLVALATMFLVRPLAVLVSTARSDYSRREQLFLSAVAPRGIVPAGVATLFAIEIQGSNPVAATNITGTVLLVVLATVVVEGGAASWLADRLDLSLAPVLSWAAAGSASHSRTATRSGATPSGSSRPTPRQSRRPARRACPSTRATGPTQACSGRRGPTGRAGSSSRPATTRPTWRSLGSFASGSTSRTSAAVSTTRTIEPRSGRSTWRCSRGHSWSCGRWSTSSPDPRRTG
jgi:NhaP-type Na+/H+ or K+/H+ antiporter